MPQLFFNEVELGSADVSTTGLLPEPVDCTSSPDPQDDPRIQEREISDSPTEKHFGKIRKNADDTCSSIGPYRRARTAFSSAQLYHLEQEFLMDPYISRSKRKTLAEFLQLPEITIKIWFQNRRMKDKRSRLNSQWQYTHSQPLSTVYGNTVVRSPPVYATYPVPSYTAPSSSPYPPMSFYGYPDIPALAHPASCGYSLCTSPQEALDIPRYPYGTSASPVESGTVPVSLSRTYESSVPLSAYYHSYPIYSTCAGLEPLNLDVKSFKTDDKKVDDTKTNRVNTLFRPFDE